MRSLTRWSRRLLPVVAVLVLGSACSSTVESRIRRHPQSWAQLSTDHQALALRNRVVEGMPRDAVYFAWGPPHRIVQGSEAGKEVERWRYVRYEPHYTQRFGFAFGPGYCGDGYGWYGPDVVYLPEPSGWVEFKGGLVSGWAREF